MNCSTQLHLRDLTPSRRPTMVYRYIHPAKKELIITMLHNGISPKLIAAQTGISPQCIRSIRRNYNNTGKVTKGRRTGCPRALTSLEVSVCLILQYGCVLTVCSI